MIQNSFPVSMPDQARQYNIGRRHCIFFLLSWQVDDTIKFCHFMRVAVRSSLAFWLECTSGRMLLVCIWAKAGPSLLVKEGNICTNPNLSVDCSCNNTCKGTTSTIILKYVKCSTNQNKTAYYKLSKTNLSNRPRG